MDDLQLDELSRDEMEPLLSKIVEWAQKNDKMVESLNKEELIEAILSRVRNSLP